MTNYSRRSLMVMTAFLMFAGLSALRAAADENDPPIRVARLAYVEGSVSFQPGGSNVPVGASAVFGLDWAA